MGNCSSGNMVRVPTARLILEDGQLREFTYPVKVSYVLQKYPMSFICNSDEMDFDDVMTAIDEDQVLRPGKGPLSPPNRERNHPFPPRKATVASKLIKESSSKLRKESSFRLQQKDGRRSRSPVAYPTPRNFTPSPRLHLPSASLWQFPFLSDLFLPANRTNLNSISFCVIAAPNFPPFLSKNDHDFVNEIKAMLDRAEPPMRAECCIYRVPCDMRKLNEDAFTPKVVSIGPFHYGHPRLQNMEKYKLVYAKHFSERVSGAISLDELINSVEEVEPIVRRCYSDTVELSSKEFVKVILMDSCFILELFIRYYLDEWPQDDIIHLKPWLKSTMRIDLFLLENQLPFFILERLFNIAFPSTTTNHRLRSFLELTFHYFGYYNSLKLTPQGVSISHFTDLIRIFHLQPLGERPRRVDESSVHLQSATELADAGVRFRKGSSPCLMDIKFSGRVLEIPQLRVEDWTETLLRNLVALEQCHYPSNSYIIDYVVVMDFLINTSKDVDILVQNGVILHWLGDTDSVANLFNSLGKNVTNANFNSHYLKLCKDLNGFCKNPWRNMMATLRRDYCNTPWQTAASIAGILLLGLSFTQTVCSILQVLQQSKQ